MIVIEMKSAKKENSSVQKLVDSYKKAFRIPENLNFYSKEDFKRAERRFVKIAIRLGIDNFI